MLDRRGALCGGVLGAASKSSSCWIGSAEVCACVRRANSWNCFTRASSISFVAVYVGAPVGGGSFAQAGLPRGRLELPLPLPGLYAPSLLRPLLCQLLPLLLPLLCQLLPRLSCQLLLVSCQLRRSCDLSLHLLMNTRTWAVASGFAMRRPRDSFSQKDCGKKVQRLTN